MTPGTVTSVVIASALATAITHATLRLSVRTTDLPLGTATAKQDGCDATLGACVGAVQVAHQPTRCSLPPDRE